MEASPSVADDGSLVLGSRLTSVFALDKATGRLVRLLSGVGGSLEEEAEGERCDFSGGGGGRGAGVGWWWVGLWVG